MFGHNDQNTRQSLEIAGGALSVGVRHRSSSSRLRSASRKAHITGAAWFWVRSLLKCKVLLPFFSQLNSMASITAAPSRDLAFDYLKSLSNAFLGPFWVNDQ
jgi:hypothetical protein